MDDKPETMPEMDDREYDPKVHMTAAQFPDNTITIVIKAGGKAYIDGRHLPETQEATARTAQALSQKLLDTIDTKGLKAGGGAH